MNIPYKIERNFNNVQEHRDYIKASCPAHDDDKPSLTIHIENEEIGLNCFAGCSTESILGVLNWEWDDLYLEETNGHQSNGSQSMSEFNEPTSWINRDLDDKVIKYLTSQKGRNFTEHAIKYNNIGQAEKYFAQVGEKRRAIVFPYIRDGRVRNAKYRDTDKNFTVESNGEQIFFGHQKLSRKPDTILVTEGEFDVLAFDSFYDSKTVESISVFNGANSNLDEPLDYAQKYFAECENVILAVDDDEPGKKLQRELSGRLGRNKCRVVNYPDDCNDLNDVIMKHSYDDARNIINNAEPFPISGVYGVGDVKDEVEYLYENGFKEGYSTGWDSLDEIYTPRKGSLHTVTGVPNQGKSSFVDSLAINMAKEHDWRFGICSPENFPTSRHVSMMLNRWVEKPFSGDNNMTKSEMEEGLEEMKHYFKWIMPEEEEMTIDSLVDKIKISIYRYGIDGVVIDPWNAFEYSKDQYTSEHHYISRILSKLRRLARENDIIIWLVAHPKKPDSDDNEWVPGPYDISGSATFNDKSDCILSVWRDMENDSNEPVVHTKKIRFQPESGKLGKVKMRYNMQSKMIEEFCNEDDEDVEF